MTARRASWLVLLVVCSIALAIGASGDPGPRTAAERVDALSRSIKCPQCPGQSVAESDVEIAREVRLDIAERVQAGQSDDDIRDFYVSRYGQDVLLTPPRDGVAGLVWVLPVAAVVVAGGVLVVTFRRWRSGEAPAVSDADRALVDGALRDGAAAPVGGTGGESTDVPGAGGADAGSGSGSDGDG